MLPFEYVYKKDSKSGKLYCAYHLVESIRTEKGPRQRTILYMGSEIDLQEGDLKMLAQRIEDIIADQRSFIPYPEKIERLAQLYASQVIHRLSTAQETHENDEKEGSPVEHVSINIHSIETSEPRTVGAEHLLLQMANQLELPKQLQELGLSKTDLSIALGSIIARGTAPYSERSTYKWLCTHSGIGELLDFDFRKIFLGKLYKISDKLLGHKAALEKHLEAIESKFHGYKSTIALYDLTNTYMAGKAESNPKACYGLSKEKRNDCPLVTMGLVMNEHVFLNRTSILPGKCLRTKNSLRDDRKAHSSSESLQTYYHSRRRNCHRK